MSAPGPEAIAAELRTRLREIADELIPAVGRMPGAGALAVERDQLDRVLAARPDLTEPLARALATSTEPAPVLLARLEREDPSAHQALMLVIVGGYYTHPDVRRLLGLEQAGPEPVRPALVPTYAEEGLLDAVLERGPCYRDASDHRVP